jgi:catechol 1,2-dioxygenase
MPSTREERLVSDRANQLISDMLRRIHEAIVENDVSYEEYQAAKQWFIDVGVAGEWPLFGDVYIEHVVEEHAFGRRDGSQGTILGPFHLPGAPVLAAPFELPHRPDEPGDPTVLSGRVTDVDGQPLAGANLDVWQADCEGRYSGFMPGPPAGNLRGQVRTDGDGGYRVRTVVPGPYTIPLDGPTGKLTAAAGWSPWRPAHVHLIVSAEGHEPLVTQLFIDSSDYLDSDVAGAVKPELIVHPAPSHDEPGVFRIEYDFALAPARTPAVA